MSTLRTSSYTISVKLEEEEDKYMLVHGYTGAIDIVNGKIAEYLQKKQVITKQNIPFSKITLEKLISRGYITSKDASEEKDHVRRFSELLHKDSKNSPKPFLFMVSYDCNFRCPYCYEGGISKQGKHWSKKTFTKELVNRAYDAMEEIEPEKGKRFSRITLYGGEPFLKENVEIVEHIVKKGIERGYDFDVISNGHDLNHFEHILATGGIKHIQITLDGDKEMHNSRRYHYQTLDSFEKVFNNIGLALNYKISVSVRFNADANNFGEIKKLKKLFEQAGYSEKPFFQFNTALLRGEENTVPSDSVLQNARNIKTNKVEKNISYLSREEFNKLHQEAGMEVSHQDYGLYWKLSSAIKYGAYLRFRSTFCGVQNNMYIFDPYGELYNCWETVGMKGHVLGNYSNSIVWTEERGKWQERNIGTTPQCSECKYALLCGGGCIAKALRNKGSFNASYCDNFPDIIKLTANKVYEEWRQAEDDKV